MSGNSTTHQQESNSNARANGEIEERGEGTKSAQVSALQHDEEEIILSQMLSELNLQPSDENQKKENGSIKEEKKKHPILEDTTIEAVAKAISDGKLKKIIVMTGAGISVAAGIPDFRSPGTGLYSNLQKYNLPYPEAVFELDFFRSNPRPFFELAKELYPTKFKPTDVHFFIKLLSDKGLLLRNFTQNIDTLERRAGVPDKLLVEAHGSFGTAHCTSKSCKQEYSQEFVKEAVFANKTPLCEKCQKVVKPDIVFFGEGLPSKFFECLQSDFEECDLLVIIGTSLQVQPFASLAGRVSPLTPRLLLNREVPETGGGGIFALLGRLMKDGFQFDEPDNVRDVKYLGDCQDAIRYFASLLGWGEELKKLVDDFKMD